MSIVTAFVGDLEVVGNGTVHISDENRLKLQLKPNLEMEFEFITDESNKASKAESKNHNNKLVWVLTNYKNPLGVGPISPIEIGTLQNRRLFVSFFVWTPNEKLSNRIINYVVYLKK